MKIPPQAVPLIMITSKELIEAGIKPGELFGKLLKECQTIEEAKTRWKTEKPVKKEKREFKETSQQSVLHWLISNDCLQSMCSREFPGKIASNSEKRRWLESGAVLLNGKVLKPDDIMVYPVVALIFFSSSNKRITML